MVQANVFIHVYALLRIYACIMIVHVVVRVRMASMALYSVVFDVCLANTRLCHALLVFRHAGRARGRGRRNWSMLIRTLETPQL